MASGYHGRQMLDIFHSTGTFIELLPDKNNKSKTHSLSTNNYKAKQNINNNCFRH